MQLSDLTWPRRTDRLLIRMATEADVAPTHRIRSTPGVSHWLTRDAGDLAEYTEMFCDPDRLASSLAIELDGEVVGDLMVRVNDAWAQSEVKDRATGTQAELGWVIDPAYAGRGIATEGAAELLRICFDDRPDGLGLRRATALCFAENTASRRIMEKLGMRLEELTRAESLHRTLGWLDGAGYAILAEEWRALS